MSFVEDKVSETRFTYYIADTLKENVVSKMKNNIKSSNNVKTVRNLAFASIRLYHDPEVIEFLPNIGKSFNFQDQPSEFQALFDEEGNVLPENQGKFAWLGMIDRKSGEFLKNKKTGLNVPDSNLNDVFGKSKNNILANNTLKKLYNQRKSVLYLSKGKASELLAYLVGPRSPLIAKGVEYLVLHAADQSLSESYYQGKFGFRPLLGLPYSNLWMEGSNIDGLRTDAPPPYDRFGVKRMDMGGEDIYVRRLTIEGEDRLYALFENDNSGPALYKKIVSAAAGAGSIGGSRRKTRRVKRRSHTPKRRVT